MISKLKDSLPGWTIITEHPLPSATKDFNGKKVRVLAWVVMEEKDLGARQYGEGPIITLNPFGQGHEQVVHRPDFGLTKEQWEDLKAASGAYNMILMDHYELGGKS